METLDTQVLNDLLILVEQQNELIAALYSNSLFIIGVMAALFVLFVLYKFIRLFY